ncbi:MAG: ABC transporter permease [Anaerolineaceae bacterium]
MRNVWTIAKREFNHYFISPIAYVVAFITLVILGIIFYTNILAGTLQQYAPPVQIVIGPLVTILLFSTPALTMRTLAEEQRTGTMELLLTAPVRDWELVVGKWLGSFLYDLVLIAITGIYPLILNRLVSPGLDLGLVFTNYLGLILIVGAILAIGIAVSSLFTNQIAAFFATLGILLVFWMISYPAQVMGASGSAVLTYLDLSQHFYNSFYVGLIEIKDIVYYLSFIVLSLFLGTVSIETRRWR